MENPAVRRAVSRDAQAISATLLTAFQEYKSLYTEEGFVATTPDPEKILERLDEGPIWVAVVDEKIVGTVSAVLKDDRTLYIRGMAVLPTARGNGVGPLLFAEVTTYAKEHNRTRLLLSTTPFLHRAIRLYERLGFVRTQEGPTDLHGTPLFSMERPV